MYCGIDISKDKSNVCIIDKNRNIIEEFEFIHSQEGFEEFSSYLTEDILIGMETTGNYSKPLYHFLCKKNYNVVYVNNVKVHRYARMKNPHMKTDKIDARGIAEYISFGFDHYKPNEMTKYKDLARIYYKTTKQLARYKRMYKDQLAVIFPELSREFSLQNNKGIPHMLLKYSRPKDIANASDEEIYTALVENLKVSSHYTFEYIRKIKRVSSTSIGIEQYPILCFRYTVRIMIFFQELTEDLLKNMKELVSESPYAKLLDKFGYNVASLATIIGEIGDIRRFSEPKKFVKYSGFDISKKQSGDMDSKNCYITKQGNKYLRYMFYNMVLCHLNKKDQYSDFYYRLKNNGKHPTQAMVATARKIAIKCYFDLLECHNN